VVSSKKIIAAIPNVLKTVSISGLENKFQGKVRDVYVVDEKRISITTDRQSAFDKNLGYIPFKGAVLNMLAAFWFDKTKDIVQNHLISVPHPNVLISKNCKNLGIEMIVRGYISGSTNTSIWGSYQQGERIIYGIKFPEGLKKNQKLKTPVITPTTHPLEKDKHDERLTREEILKKKLVTPKIYKQMEDAALSLFEYGTKVAKKAGLILVDTKYEFGLDSKGKLMLIDEVHTPDSSRYWIAKTYQERFKKGLEPENFDKEFLRLWYTKKVDPYNDKLPKMSEELIVALSKRYIAVYERLSGKKFKGLNYPVEKEIKEAIKDYLKNV